jgi:hypothetical protein
MAGPMLSSSPRCSPKRRGQLDCDNIMLQCDGSNKQHNKPDSLACHGKSTGRTSFPGVHMEHPIRDVFRRDGGDEEYNNIYSSDDLLVGTITDFIRHRAWELLNTNRELPTSIAHMSSSPTSDSELDQPNGVSR